MKHRVTAASERLEGDLRSVLHRADRLAEAAARITCRPTEPPRSRVLSRLVPAGGPEMSVVVFDPQGDPWAWAGRHRLPPRSEGRLGRRANEWILRRARGPAPLAGGPERRLRRC